jgi:hypothetical protein
MFDILRTPQIATPHMQRIVREWRHLAKSHMEAYDKLLNPVGRIQKEVSRRVLVTEEPSS